MLIERLTTIFRQRLLPNDEVVTKKPLSTNEVVHRRSD